MQVYRGLDIGSGKPSPEQRQKIAHHCIDIVDPDYRFTAGDFCREAFSACETIRKSGRIPLFVGGTGLYIDSFFKGISSIPEIASTVKEVLERELDERGLDKLYRELLSCDPVFAGRVHCNDRQRILRGLEVYRGTGRPLSWFFGNKEGHESAETLYIGLNLDRAALIDRIHCRVDDMIGAGFVEEVARLREMGYGPGLNSMKSIGYAELNAYLDGRLSLEEAVEAIKIETRKYAKRQMTWFKKNGRVTWFRYFEIEKIRSLVYTWL